MSLKDVFKKSFWKNRWNDTLAGFAAYGQAYCGLPPNAQQPPAEEKPAAEKPAAEKAPEAKPPAPKPPGQ